MYLCNFHVSIIYFVNMWINRSLEGKIQHLVATRPVVLVTGARQTGKTSILQHLFPGYRFVSLDLPSEAEQAEASPSTFLDRHPSPVIIDEIQYAPALLRFLKIAVDSNRTQPGQYVLTGSQKFELMKGAAESLAGRVEILELDPLSLEEIVGAEVKLSVESILLRGGYPELYRDLRIDPVGFYRSYVATYLERDLRSLLNVASLKDFERFLRACALRSGQLVNKADLARDIGISPATANQWLSVLVSSNIVFLLEPWFLNRSRSITKSPKLYLSDTGLLLYLLNIRNLDDLSQSPLVGSIWETFVFNELRKKQIHAFGEWSLFFWRDRKKEIDFLIHRGGRFDLIEVKWSEIPRQRDANAFSLVADIIGREKIASQTIICRTPNPYPMGEDTIVTSISDYELPC